MKKLLFNKKKINIVISIILILILVIVGIAISNNNEQNEAEKKILHQLKDSRSFKGYEIEFIDRLNTYTLTTPDESEKGERLISEYFRAAVGKSDEETFGIEFDYEETEWYDNEKIIEKASKKIFDSLGSGYTIELKTLVEENSEDNLMLQATDGEITYNVLFSDVSE